MKNPDPPLTGAKTIAAYVGRSPRFVFDRLNDANTPWRKVAGRIVARQSELEAWLQNDWRRMKRR